MLWHIGGTRRQTNFKIISAKESRICHEICHEFSKILYQRVLLDNSDGFEPPRLHQKRNPLIKPMSGFFLISCGFCGCKTYHYGAWVFNRFQLFFNAICHESATTILPTSAKWSSKNLTRNSIFHFSHVNKKERKPALFFF